MFMSSDADIADRDLQMLDELAELDLALARHVHACALATDDPARVADLSRAYQRMSRSVRQTLALKAKLKREAEQHARWLEVRDRDRRTPMREPTPAPIDPAAQRRDDLESAVARVIWAEREFEGPDWEDRQERCFERMDSLFRVPHYVERLGKGTLDEDVITLCGDLGLSRANALNWRNLPEPDFEEEGDDGDAGPRRSSA